VHRIVFVVLVSLFSIQAAPASASCGAATCPIDTTTQRQGGERWLDLGYEFEYVPQDRPWVYGEKGYARQIRGHHDEVYSISRVHRLKAAATATDRLILELTFPYVSRSHQHVHRHQGADLVDAWNISGIGDIALLGRWLIWKPDQDTGPYVSVLTGVKAPTGRAHLTNDANEEAEAPVQPGTGSWDFSLGASWLMKPTAPALFGEARPMPWFVSSTYRWNGRSYQRYQIGDVYQLNAGAIYPVASWLGLQGQANLRVNREDSKGETGEEVAKTGGTYVFLSPGLQAQWNDWTLSALVQVPVYQRVQRIQLAAPYSLVAGVTRRFSW
jgi:hypothetical protein